MIATEKRKLKRISVKTDQTIEPIVSFVNDTAKTHKSPPTLTEKLNRLISQGVKFEVSAGNFQAFGASERENAFLQADKAAVLCTLQQGFLQKELFRHSPDLLKDFETEVHERSAIMSDGEPGTHFQAVCEVTREWISEQIEKL